MIEMTLDELYSRNRRWHGDGRGWIYFISARVRGKRKMMPLYIGKTEGSPRGRISQHIHDEDLLGLAIKMKKSSKWNVLLLTAEECIDFQYSECSRKEQRYSITDLASAELFMIRHWLPIFNFAATRIRFHDIEIHKDFLCVFAKYRPDIWGLPE